MIFFEYSNIFFYCCCLTFIFLLLIIINIIFIPRLNYTEKLSSYECGFQSFEYSISTFDIRYYIIAVLFLLFDLELIFFIPYLMSTNFFNLSGLLSILFFLLLLIMSFFYEWKLNILNFSDLLYQKLYFKYK